MIDTVTYLFEHGDDKLSKYADNILSQVGGDTDILSEEEVSNLIDRFLNGENPKFARKHITII